MENTPKNPDRRSEPRHDILIEVKIMTIGKTLFGTATNISGGGMESRINEELNPNTTLAVSMQLDNEIIFKGKVIWTLGDFENGRWLYRVGIQTECIEFGNRELVSPQEKRHLVQKLLPSIRGKKSDEKHPLKIQHVA